MKHSISQCNINEIKFSFNHVLLIAKNAIQPKNNYV